MQQINKKIVSYKVVTKDKEEVVKTPIDVLPTDRVVEILSDTPLNFEKTAGMGEHVDRLEVLTGTTYKIKPSNSEHAYYITINNIEVEGNLHPYELFINSKGIEHYKLLGFARLVSAIFRKAGDISFLADELKQIYDPTGAYTSRRCYESGKRKRFNSIEAEIGDIIEEHLAHLTKQNGYKNWTIEDTIQAMVDDIPELLYNELGEVVETDGVNIDEFIGYVTEFPPNATTCPKCSCKAVVILDGCATCLQCGDSKCG